MNEQEPQQPESPLQSESPLHEGKNENAEPLWGRIKNDFRKYVKDNYIGIGISFIVPLIIYLGSWLLFGEKSTLVDDGRDFAERAKECSMGRMDEITGEVQLNGQIKRGAEITLMVHNKIKNSWEMVLTNEAIDNRDGTFKFHFCKAITDFVRFNVKIIGKDTIPIEYPVDEILEKIPL